MKTKHVIVKPYNKEWKKEFEKISLEIKEALGNLAISIEHVGSTSVEGLPAKPIIDIDVVIDGHYYLNEVIEKLKAIGYEHEGDLGIEGREAFKYENKPHLMIHHLYVCSKDSPELKRHIAFRDYLRSNDEARREYGDIKIKGAELFPYDIDSYIEYKSSVVNDIMKRINESK